MANLIQDLKTSSQQKFKYWSSKRIICSR